MKKLVFLPVLLSFLIIACGLSDPPRPSTPTAGAPTSGVEPTPTATLPLPPPPTSSVSVYQSQKYGYSFSYPSAMQLAIQSDEYFEVGDKIVVFVSEVNPMDMHGDGPVYESDTTVQPARYPARLLTGYIGSVGGNFPQQIRRYIFEHNGVFITFTLYGLGLHATEGDVSQIAPIYSEDQNIFDNIVKGLELQ